MYALKGIIFVLLLIWTCIWGSLFMMAPFIPLLWISQAVHQRCQEKMVALWQIFAACLLEWWLGIKFVLYGDLLVEEPCVIIVNHRTRLDWLYLWNVVLRQSKLSHLKILLKKELKAIPGGGWAMQAGGYFFLKRNWDQDKLTLQNGIKYYSLLKNTAQLLIFPEGTDLSPHNKELSHKYADRENLCHYENVLHPRTTGFVHMVNCMRAGGQLSSVYDLTIAYPNGCPISEADLLLGSAPSEVHVSIRRYNGCSIPEGDAEIANWCNQIWQQKELELDQFYTHNSFNTHKRNNCSLFLTYLATLVFWFVFSILIIFLLYHYTITFTFYVLIFILVFEYFHIFHDGLEMFSFNRLVTSSELKNN